jgi:hypothetical protein
VLILPYKHDGKIRVERYDRICYFNVMEIRNKMIWLSYYDVSVNY